MICICASQGTSMDGWPAGTDPNCPLHGTNKVNAMKEGPAPGTPMWYERRIRELEKKNESLELVAAYAKDVLAFWPQFSFRTIRIMVGKMDNLKQALDLIR